MYLLNFILFCCLTIATAQVDDPGTNTGNPGLTGGGGLPNQLSNSTGGGHETQDGCVYQHEFYVLLANLDILNGSIPADSCTPDPSNSYCAQPLPIGYPTLKLRFTLNNTTILIEPDSFELAVPATDSTPSLYGVARYISFSVAGYCTKGEDASPIPFTISSEMLTDGPNGTLIPYPICSYTAPGDIFTCDYFAETSGYCLPNSRDCNNLALGSFSISGEIGCSDCEPIQTAPQEIPKDSIPGNPSFKKQNPSDLLLSKELQVEVSPNPFRENLNIYLEQGGSNIQIKVFDTTGRMVKSTNGLDLGPGTAFELDTADLPKGMYILHVSNGEKDQFVKLIKPE